MKIPTNQFRTGTKILLDGAPCSILSHEFHKPGKGQAVVRIKYRNLLSGNVLKKLLNLMKVLSLLMLL